MGGWIFTWIQAKAMTILLVITLSAGGVYVGRLKYENWDLRSALKEAERQLQFCVAENAKLKFQNQSFNESLDQMEVQCKELLKYERNKPKKDTVDDQDVDDAYLDKLFGGLRNRGTNNKNSPGADPSSKNHAPGKTGSSTNKTDSAVIEERNPSK